MARSHRRLTLGRLTLGPLMWGLLMSGLATMAGAQTIPTFRLLHPSDVEQVTLSPSGERIAALTPAPDGNGLIVLQWRNGSVAAVLGNRLGNDRSFTSYRWLTDDFLLLHYTDYRQDEHQSLLVDVPRRTVHYLNALIDIIKVPWGDSSHALVSSTGEDCASSVAARCLMSLNLAGGDSQPVADALTLQPLEFVPLSPREIYARGRDAAGMEHEYQLDVATHFWKPAPQGTFERERQLAMQQQRTTRPPDDAVLNAAARAGIHQAEPVTAQPSGQVVALIGHAPERSMVAVDSRLDGIEALVQSQLAGERVAMSGFNDELTRGLLRVWDTDHPERFLFMTDSGLHEYAPLAVQFDVAKLGRTHIERGWVPGVAVSVTLPPEGVALIGAVVVPLTTRQGQAENALHEYRSDVQVLATHGIAVVRLLAALPDSFPDNAAGAMWRAALKQAMQTLVTQASQRLLQGHDVCLYGQDTDGELALGFGDLQHVGCVIAVNALLDPRSALRTQVITRAPNTPGSATLTMSLGEQALQTDIPAAFGGSDNSLMDPAYWGAAQPAHIMLAYNMALLDGPNLAAQSGAFRSAAARTGKRVSFYASQAPYQGPNAADVTLADAVAAYAVQQFAGVPASPVAAR